jgi:hypothetical protein
MLAYCDGIDSWDILIKEQNHRSPQHELNCALLQESFEAALAYSGVKDSSRDIFAEDLQSDAVKKEELLAECSFLVA